MARRLQTDAIAVAISGAFDSYYPSCYPFEKGIGVEGSE